MVISPMGRTLDFYAAEISWGGIGPELVDGAMRHRYVRRDMNQKQLAIALSLFLFTSVQKTGFAQKAAAPGTSSGVTKLKDIVVYRDDTFYSAFPSIVRRPDGELLVAFRRAPEQRNFGTVAVSHTDPNSQLVMVRSTDDGQTWSKDPQLIFAHPRGGLQDPCMIQLDDRSILCTSYGWALVPKAQAQNLKNPARIGDFVCMGGNLFRSDDGAKSWSEIPLPPTHGEKYLDLFNRPVPACNRGSMYQGKDGRVFWVTAMEDPGGSKVIGTHLMISSDRGKTWVYSCPVAADPNISFNETSIYETPKGDLVAFMRTERPTDFTTMARSTDGGKSFQKWTEAGFPGHPHHAIRLPDQRVLLVYGFRQPPYGIRARVLNAECTDTATAPEIVLRDDGGGFDLGYPWVTMVGTDRALVVYYFNEKDGTRYIGGTLLQIGPDGPSGK